MTNGERDEVRAAFGRAMYMRSGREWELVGELLDAVAAGDSAAYEALFDKYPALRVEYSGIDATVELMRTALTSEADLPYDAAFADAAARTQAELGRIRLRNDEPRVEAAATEDNGILTRLAARLAPQEALALFRRIAPRLVLGVLARIDDACQLERVRRVVDHLCADDTQTRLRSAEHVRDAILDEIGAALCDAGLKERLGRDGLSEIMTAGGVMNDLIIMERCILVARRVA